MVKNEIRHQFTDKPSSTRLRKELAAGLTRETSAPQTSLAGRFREPTAGSAELTQEDRLNRREAAKRRLFRMQVGALATMAAVTLGISAAGGVQNVREGVGNTADALAERFFPSATGHTYSQEDLAQLPQDQVTVQPGEGVDQVILDAEKNGQSNKESGIFSDGPDLTAVREYVNVQNPGVLQPGEQVNVPILPTDGN